jgi:hypothetical protein
LVGSAERCRIAAYRSLLLRRHGRATRPSLAEVAA